eukprot:16447457-Heterocapsa_arctica.AAC.1
MRTSETAASEEQGAWRRKTEASALVTIRKWCGGRCHGSGMQEQAPLQHTSGACAARLCCRPGNAACRGRGSPAAQ